MQDTDVTSTLQIQGLEAALTVRRLRGTEAINALYSFRLVVSAESPSLDLDAIVGKQAVITIASGGHHRSVHGVVCDFEQAETNAAFTEYDVTVVPQAWLLTQGARCRILQGLTTAKVIEAVLVEAGLPAAAYRLSIQSASAPREVCAQYQESDWAFVTRLMEEEGIFYFFDHTDAASVLVIADHASIHEQVGERPEVPFMPPTGAQRGREHVEALRVSTHIRPGRVTLRDAPFDVPTKRRDDAAEHAKDRALEVFAYPAGPHAQRRLDALQVGRHVATGRAACTRLFPGGLFTLTNHPRASFDVGYLVNLVEHALSPSAEGATYACDFACIPAGAACRPVPTVAKPLITGPQAALVVGPKGTEIHVDERGRVLVKLEWDRSDPHDLGCAVWVHASQGASGPGYGAVQVPRVGSYVLVEFLSGDPDRPIITGRVYNTLSPYPYALPDGKSKSTLKSHSTPGGGGFNELRFEDNKGHEQVYLRAQRNLDVEALHDATRRIGRDDELQVGGSRSTLVTGAETQVVGLAHAVRVGGAQEVGVALARALTVGGNLTESVGGDHAATVGGDATLSVVGNASRAIGGSSAAVITGDRTAQVGGGDTVAIEGSELHEVAGNQSIAVNGNLQQIVDGGVFLTQGALTVAVSADTAIHGAGEVKIESETTMKLGAPAVYVSGDSTIHVRAYEKIVLEVASSDDDDDGDSAKIEITRNGVYLTSGGATKKLTGDKIHLNC